MPAQIYTMPPRDPREQPVQPAAGGVAPDVEVNGQNVCVGCATPTRLHYSRLTDAWIGCTGAIKQAHELPSNPERWNDPYSVVTAQVRRAMVDGTCGPRFEIEMAGYVNDEQVTIAATLTRIAIATYLREIAK